jgi:hypothetical protein
VARAGLRRVVCVCAAVLSACTDRASLERRANAPPAQRLVAAWDVRFDLERSPALAPSTDRARSVTGTLVFVGNRWLDASYPPLRNPTNYGTYDVDFTPLGFETRDRGRPPTLVASASAADSVAIIFTPGPSQVTVWMQGAFVDDSIIGAWVVTLSRVGGGGGRFAMRRHASPD